ncbi:hypothetical protein IQ265_13805 [Nodosilinea sp. LEGE 06152]|uniref:hypothetical protein n=1 Tax=Nodosilinea sp. LEGE 06152 TaxID=2777966 RepID=UPI001881185A|nr:hypothetical protein [Nodosilinea sp. LEGE 06152]MBE9157891.1 hypothetical protein [Nodosilinea sp. LEGE 06152]
MTLTAADIEGIRRFLGYPGDMGTHQAIAAQCAARVAEISEPAIRAHLRQLERLQTQMTTTVPFAAQTFSSGAGGTQQYAPGQRMATLHQEANQYIDEIASTTGLVVYRRIYGGGDGGGRWSGGLIMRG